MPNILNNLRIGKTIDKFVNKHKATNAKESFKKKKINYEEINKKK